jgi:hypothetical protein
MIKDCFRLPWRPTRLSDENLLRLPKCPSETCHLLNVAKTMRSSAIFAPVIRYRTAADFWVGVVATL